LKDELKNIQEVLGESPLLPCLDVRTRWNSTYYMLERWVQIQGSISVLFHQGKFDKAQIYFPNVNMTARISLYLKLLRPLQRISLFLEGEKYCTLAHVPKLVYMIMQNLRGASYDNAVVDAVRLAILKDIEKRFGWIFTTVNEALLAAAVHPAHGHLDFIDEDLRNRVWEKLKELCDVVYTPAGGVAATDAFGDVIQDPHDNRHAALDILRKRFEHHLHRQYWPFNYNYGDLVHDDMHRPWFQYYIDDEKGGIPNAKPQAFVCIHLLVKMVMALPATTGSSERVFSSSGFLNPPRRSSLAPYMLEYLTVIRGYLNSGFYNFEELFRFFCRIIHLPEN
jgi:hypothetical protein